MLDFTIHKYSDSVGEGEALDCHHFPPQLAHLSPSKSEPHTIKVCMIRIVETISARLVLRFLFVDFVNSTLNKAIIEDLYGVWLLFDTLGVTLYFRFQLQKALLDYWLTLFEEGSRPQWHARANENFLVAEVEVHKRSTGTDILLTVVSIRADVQPSFNRNCDVYDYVKNVPALSSRG